MQPSSLAVPPTAPRADVPYVRRVRTPRATYTVVHPRGERRPERTYGALTVRCGTGWWPSGEATVGDGAVRGKGGGACWEGRGLDGESPPQSLSILLEIPGVSPIRTHVPRAVIRCSELDNLPPSATVEPFLIYEQVGEVQQFSSGGQPATSRARRSSEGVLKRLMVA